MTVYVKLPPNRGHVSIMGVFFKTRRCLLFRDFTVYLELGTRAYEILRLLKAHRQISQKQCFEKYSSCDKAYQFSAL